jgi:hypothetical protein
MNRWAQLVVAVIICALSATTIAVRAGRDDVLARAADALKKEPSFRTVFSIRSQTRTTFGMEMAGTVDQRTKLGRFTMRFAVPGTRTAINCDLITSADKVYIAVPAKNRARFGGKPWVASAVAGLLPIQGFGTKGFDPSSFAAIHDLKKTGTDTVRGVATTTYRGTLDIDKSKFTSANSAVTTAVPDHVPADLWVSSDGLIRKIQDTFVTHVGTVAVTTTSSFEYFDFGVPIQVNAPRASDVDQGDVQSAIGACVT